MAELERRLQVLIDDERYRRLREASERTGAPVGALVRRAIDHEFSIGEARPRVVPAPTEEERRRLRRRFLERTARGVDRAAVEEVRRRGWAGG